MDDFCQRLAQVLDVEEVRPGDVIEDLPDWDSLAAFTVIAMVGSRFGVHLQAQQLKSLTTVQDLVDFVALNRRAA